MFHYASIGPDHKDAPEARDFIQSIYGATYGAHIPSFAPRLVTARSGDGQIIAACGLRLGGSEGFSDKYLSRPVAEMASRLMGQRVSRCQILEVTTFAATRPVAVFSLLDHVVTQGRMLGMKAGMFTATASLRALMTRAKLPIVDLAPARPEHLENAGSWGRYYDCDPHVCLLIDSPETQLVMNPRNRTANTLSPAHLKGAHHA